MILERPTSEPFVLLRGVPWETYVTLRDLEENWGTRMVYDEGTLILMSPSHRHERTGRALARLVEHWAVERDLPLVAGGATTFRDEIKKKGLEPDSCFYVSSAKEMKTVVDYEFGVHPPPDLAVEVEVTNVVGVKVEIYRELGIPELWIVGLDGLRFLALRGDAYEPVTHSASFPELQPTDLEPFLERVYEIDDTQLVREFRTWVREKHGR